MLIVGIDILISWCDWLIDWLVDWLKEWLSDWLIYRICYYVFGLIVKICEGVDIFWEYEWESVWYMGEDKWLVLEILFENKEEFVFIFYIMEL